MYTNAIDIVSRWIRWIPFGTKPSTPGETISTFSSDLLAILTHLSYGVYIGEHGLLYEIFEDFFGLAHLTPLYFYGHLILLIMCHRVRANRE